MSKFDNYSSEGGIVVNPEHDKLLGSLTQRKEISKLVVEEPMEFDKSLNEEYQCSKCGMTNLRRIGVEKEDCFNCRD